SVALSSLCSVFSYSVVGYLHSFPTRRSSDLDSARRTLRVLLANGNRQVALAFFDRFQYRFGDSQCRRTDVSERPEPLKYNGDTEDRKSTRLNSSHEWISYAVFCLKKKTYHKS